MADEGDSYDYGSFDTGHGPILYTNTDLTNLKTLTAVPQPPRPAPYYQPRGTSSYYGYRNGVKVVTLGGPN